MNVSFVTVVFTVEDQFHVHPEPIVVEEGDYLPESLWRGLAF
jgi:hypothetical protein